MYNTRCTSNVKHTFYVISCNVHVRKKIKYTFSSILWLFSFLWIELCFFLPMCLCNRCGLYLCNYFFTALSLTKKVWALLNTLRHKALHSFRVESKAIPRKKGADTGTIFSYNQGRRQRMLSTLLSQLTQCRKSPLLSK